MDFARADLVRIEPKPASINSRIAPIALTGPLVIRPPDPQVARAREAVARISVMYQFVVAPVSIPAQYVAMDVCLLSGLMLAAGVAHLSVWSVKGIMWRVATYSKGAWAAIIIVISTLFALADILLKG